MMRRRLAFFVLALAGCTPGFNDSSSNPPIDLTTVVRAQFDPANPIPVLRIVPTPTGLAQLPNGTLDPKSVAPAPCELPSIKQCLQFVQGWPTTTPITLFFSGGMNDLDPKSLPAGIILLELPQNGAPVPVMLDASSFTISPRPPIPAACQMGNNGSDPTKTFTAMDVPPGVQVVVTPKMPIKPNTRYAVLVVSSDMGGLRTAMMKKVEPSALFSLMNVDQANAPVQMDGTITNAILRSQVETQILNDVFAGKAMSSFTDDDTMKFNAALKATGQQLYGLYTFFDGLIAPLVTANVVKRSDLTLANAWSTGPATPTQIEFDPTHQKLPFPNDQVLTVTSTTVVGGLRVNLPIDPRAPAQTRALLAGLNTLNGFSTTAPIAMTATADIDPMSIDPTPATPCTADDCNIVMYPLDAMGHPDSMHPVPLIVRTSTRTMYAPPTIAIVPAIPLLENTDYVVGVKAGLKDMMGGPVTSAQAFDLLKIPLPFVDAMGMVANITIPGTTGTLEQALECSTATTGKLANATVVQGNAAALETQLNHQRWIQAMTALESLSSPIPRTSLLMGFTYKTQSITHDVDQMKAGLLDRDAGGWEDLLPKTSSGAAVRIVDTGVVWNGRDQIAAGAKIADNLCVGICKTGAIVNMDAHGHPGVPQTMCTDAMGHATMAVEQHDLCQLAISLVTTGVARAHLYLLKGYSVESGGPYQTMPGKSGTFTLPTIAHPRIVDIPMWVIVGTGTAAAAGYPVAIFQHGLASVKEAGFYIASTFAQQRSAQDPAGWATVMIDLPFHGQRASDLVRYVTPQGTACDPTQTSFPGCLTMPCDVDPADVVCGPPAAAMGRCIDKHTMMAACDGLQDRSGEGFLGVNLFATRDNFRQGTIDQLTLIRALQKEGRSGGALSYLDGTRIGYVGQSLGGITGGNLAAYVTPAEMKAMVLNVGGGGLVQNLLLYTIPDISAPLFAGLAQAGSCTLKTMNPADGCLDTPAYRQFLIIGEWILDPGDPLANSIGVKDDLPNRMPLTPSKVMIQMSMPDPVVPNRASLALGAAYGFRLDGMDPQSHFQIYDFSMLPQAHVSSGCHPFLLAPLCGRCLIDNLCQSLGAQHQAADFLASGGASISPQTRNVAGFNCVNPCQ